MVNIAIFASGNGSNFENIVNHIHNKDIEHAECKILIVDKEHAFAIERAEKLGIKYMYVNPKAFPSKIAYEACILAKLEELSIDLVVLAGYMRIISPVLLQAFPKRIINLHPAYLPSFPGKQSILDAYEAGVSETGVTVHYIDEGIDTGEIIRQEKVLIEKSWTLEVLEEHIHALEYRMFPEVLKTVVNSIESEESR